WDGRLRFVGCALHSKETLGRDPIGLSPYFDTWSVVSRQPDGFALMALVMGLIGVLRHDMQ
ncbi:MAG TPA: hypothetical protein PKW66_13480, partial [Polyangiaceae bacterium]|nr:hypothetical protein [Polyangiaceae bacterium]